MKYLLYDICIVLVVYCIIVNSGITKEAYYAACKIPDPRIQNWQGKDNNLQCTCYKNDM